MSPQLPQPVIKLDAAVDREWGALSGKTRCAASCNFVSLPHAREQYPRRSVNHQLNALSERRETGMEQVVEVHCDEGIATPYRPRAEGPGFCGEARVSRDNGRSRSSDSSLARPTEEVRPFRRGFPSRPPRVDRTRRPPMTALFSYRTTSALPSMQRLTYVMPTCACTPATKRCLHITRRS